MAHLSPLNQVSWRLVSAIACQPTERSSHCVWSCVVFPGATAEFELDGMKPHLQSIRIMGAGSLRMEPEVSCVEEERCEHMGETTC